MPTGQRPSPPNHSAHITVLGLQDNFPWANTFWIRNGGEQVPSQSEFTTLTNEFAQQYVNHILPLISTSTSMSEVTGLYYANGEAQLASAISVTNPGQKAGTPMPLNVSCCIGWRVQQHYRGGHPRTYLAGIVIDVILNGRQFLPAYAADVANHANAFLAGVNGISEGAFSSCHLGVVSFVLRKEWRSPPVFRDFVPGSAHCDPRVDSQRRRLGRDVPP